MKKVILHIGRNKTGTTSIQRFLYQNRAQLREFGFVYPEHGIRGFGHHDLGAPLTRSSLSQSDEPADCIVKKARAELNEVFPDDSSVIVLSSESFQNCDPKVIRKFLAGYDVDVVVYIREQVQYMVSAYAQKVQSSDYCGSLEEFVQQSSHSTYKEFLHKWDMAFDSQVSVKNYDREALADGDVVMDFCKTVLGLNSDFVHANYCKTDANPTLTRDLLEFKLWVNQNLVLSPTDSRVLFNAMSRLAVKDQSGSLQITPELADKILLRYQKSNRYVAKKYFNRRGLFRPYKPGLVSHAETCLEVRLASVRQRLVHSTPDLELLLPAEEKFAGIETLTLVSPQSVSGDAKADFNAGTSRRA